MNADPVSWNNASVRQALLSRVPEHQRPKLTAIVEQLPELDALGIPATSSFDTLYQQLCKARHQLPDKDQRLSLLDKFLLPVLQMCRCPPHLPVQASMLLRHDIRLYM
jgi:hypothetical protein